MANGLQSRLDSWTALSQSTKVPVAYGDCIIIEV
jgi:hypothetical protein